jgi:hypothetical protein
MKQADIKLRGRCEHNGAVNCRIPQLVDLPNQVGAVVNSDVGEHQV